MAGDSNLLTLKDWAVAETITGVKLNKQVSDRLNAIYAKNIAVRTISDTRNALNNRVANTAVPFDSPIKLVHTMPRTGTIRLTISVRCLARRHTGAVAWTRGRLDVKVDDDWFVTSGTTTSLTDGLVSNDYAVLHIQQNLTGTFIIPNISEGLHTYELYGAADSGDFSVEVLPNSQYIVEQYGETLDNILVYGNPL